MGKFAVFTEITKGGNEWFRTTGQALRELSIFDSFEEALTNAHEKICSLAAKHAIPFDVRGGWYKPLKELVDDGWFDKESVLPLKEALAGLMTDPSYVPARGALPAFSDVDNADWCMAVVVSKKELIVVGGDTNLQTDFLNASDPAKSYSLCFKKTDEDGCPQKTVTVTLLPVTD